MKDYLYFDSIKERRGSYFVEYGPPVANSKFATLNLIFLEPLSWENVSQYLDKEIRFWIGRYPVPLMVWAYDDSEHNLRPTDSNSSCLCAWVSPENGEIEQSWDIEDLTNFLDQSPARPDWRTIYPDIPFKTDLEVKTESRQRASAQARQVKLLKLFLILWLSAIPTGYALFEFLGPGWLGLIGLAIVIWNALKLALQIWGRMKLSPKEVAEAEKKRKMEHYFYHCELNPEGFLRLKGHNLEIDARERIRKVADELAAKTDQ